MDSKTIQCTPRYVDKGNRSMLDAMKAKGELSFIEKQLAPLPVIEDKPVPEREWLVEGLIPLRVVTLYSGDGGTGKTQTALQLIVAASLWLEWLGKVVGPGPCLLYTAEDETDETPSAVRCDGSEDRPRTGRS